MNIKFIQIFLCFGLVKSTGLDEVSLNLVEKPTTNTGITYNAGRAFGKTLKRSFNYGFFMGQGKSPKFAKKQLSHLQKMGSPKPFFITTKDGHVLNARFSEGNRNGMTVVVFTGMASSLEGMVNVGRWYKENANVNVLMFSRRGYGASSGNAPKSGEEGLFYDVQAVISYLHNVKQIPTQKIVLHGLSLGAAYATLGGKYFKLGGIVIDRPFTSLDGLAKSWSHLPKSFRDGMISVWSPKGNELEDTKTHTKEYYEALFQKQAKLLKEPAELVPIDQFIDPLIPFVTDGYDNIKKLDSDMATKNILFLYGLKDGVIKKNENAAIRSVLQKKGVAKENMVPLPVSHTQFFLKGEGKHAINSDAASRVLNFIDIIEKNTQKQ